MLRPGLIAIVIIMMAAWAGHSLARLFWLFSFQQPSAAAGAVLPPASGMARNDKQLNAVDVAYLQENFRLSNGRGDNAQVTSAGDSSQAASTRLSLVLRGAIAGSVPADSSAIIANGEQQRVYFPGDELQFTTPGVTLESVHAQYVVLNNNGRLESLWMYEPLASVNAPAARTDIAGVATIVPAPDRAGATQLQGRVQLRVYRDDGNVVGLQIREDSAPALLSAAGLQVGDVITAIDGIAVNQNNDFSALSRQLESRDRVTVELIRNNTPMTVTVSRDAFAF